MLWRLLLSTSLITALLVPQETFATTNTGSNHLYQLSQWNEYVAQSCDPVNDPSTCRPS